MSFARSEHVGEGIWMVWCVECGTEIGTMDGDTLAQAMYWAIGKGGVKCPACRKFSCVNCGAQLSTSDLMAVQNGLCWFCDKQSQNGAMVKPLV